MNDFSLRCNKWYVYWSWITDSNSILSLWFYEKKCDIKYDLYCLGIQGVTLSPISGMVIEFLPHQVVWFMGFYPFSGRIIGFSSFSGFINGIYADSDLIHLQWYYPQWRLSSIRTAMSVHLPSYLSSLVSSSYI